MAIAISTVTEEQILNDLNRIAQERGLINEVFKTSRIYMFFAVFSKVLGNLLATITRYMENMTIESATDEALLNQLIKPFVEKRNAKTAKTILTFTRRDMNAKGAYDIFIPRNFEVMTEGSNPIIFRTAESRILWKDSYRVRVPAYSVEFGAINNVPANRLVYFEDGEFSSVEVTNEEAAFGGADEETAYDARNRIGMFRYARDGSKTALDNLMSELGFYFGQYNAIEYWDGFGTILIAIDTENEEELKDIINRIEFRKVNGVKYSYVRANRIYLNMEAVVKVTGDRTYDDYELESLEDSINTAVQMYFSQSMIVGKSLSPKRLISYVINYLVDSQYNIYDVDINIAENSSIRRDKETGEVVVAPYEIIYPNKVLTKCEYNIR